MRDASADVCSEGVGGSEESHAEEPWGPRVAVSADAEGVDVIPMVCEDSEPGNEHGSAAKTAVDEEDGRFKDGKLDDARACGVGCCAEELKGPGGSCDEGARDTRGEGLGGWGGGGP